MPITVRKKASPSAFWRWNELRPMIEPKPPPSRLAKERLVFAARSAREDHNPFAVECALYDVAHAVGHSLDGNVVALVHLLGFSQLDMRAGQFDLDDMSAELGGDLRGVSDHVDGGFTFLAEAGATRVRPEYHRQTFGLGFLGDLARLFVHDARLRGARIDGEADRRAPQAQGVVHAAGDRGERVLLVIQHVVVVEFEDQRDFTKEVGGTGFDESQRRGIGVTAGLDGQLEVIIRVIAGRVRREAAGRAVLEALVHRQDHELAGATEAAVVEQTGKVHASAGIIALVPAQDLTYTFSHKHDLLFRSDKTLFIE